MYNSDAKVEQMCFYVHSIIETCELAVYKEILLRGV